MSKHAPDYRSLIAHYEACLARHGDTHLGVDWPDAQDAATRYRVMLDVIHEPAGEPVSLLDFGCGAGHLLDYIRKNNIASIDYRGLDASPKFISLCMEKFPGIPFRQQDILADPADFGAADYIVLNGVLTERRDMAWVEMYAYMERLLETIWPFARRGVAFNVMSMQVDWERDDLFHVPFDAMADFVSTRLSPHFRFRHDYGLYDYTTYVYRNPSS